jgi:hypothetical protein
VEQVPAPHDLENPEMTPAITTFPADEAQCVLDCLAGTCSEPKHCQLHSASVVFDYAQYTGQNAPASDAVCDLGPDLTAALKVHKSAVAMRALNLNWLALAQTILAFIQTMLAGVNPPSPPPPAAA